MPVAECTKNDRASEPLARRSNIIFHPVFVQLSNEGTSAYSNQKSGAHADLRRLYV